MAASTVTAPHLRRHPSTRQIAEAIYAQHHQRLLQIAKHNSANPDDAEEALQDAFVLFMRHFDPAQGVAPLPWLTLTLKRRCWRLYRRQRSQNAASRGGDAEAIPDPQRLPEDVAEATEAVQSATRRFDRLAAAERRALGLQALGYSYLEIVAITGWTYTKVNRCITEGRASIRRTQSPIG